MSAASSHPVLASGTNTHFSHTVSVQAPAQRVWDVWMDVADWPRWDSEVKQAKADGPLAVGVGGWVLPLRGLRSRFTITEHQPCHRYALESALILATLVVTRSLRVVNDGPSSAVTVFTHEVRFVGPLGFLFAALLGPSFRNALPVVMGNIAQLVQRPSEGGR
jgi:Polyketide cyclase / dehydrase and lipid transport